MRRNKRKRDIPQKATDVKRKRTDAREIRHVNQRSEDTPHSSHIEMHADGSDVATQHEFQQQSENRDCPHCHSHFVSSSAFQFHKKTKTNNQNQLGIILLQETMFKRRTRSLLRHLRTKKRIPKVLLLSLSTWI